MEETNTLALVNNESGDLKSIVEDLVIVERGQIIVQFDRLKAVDHEFLILNRPSSNMSLRGFYINNGYLFSFRADLWNEKKPFYYLSSATNDYVTGTCR